MRNEDYKTGTKTVVGTLPNLGMAKQHLLDSFKRYYSYRLGRDEKCRRDYAYEAFSLAIGDRMSERWEKTYNLYKELD